MDAQPIGDTFFFDSTSIDQKWIIEQNKINKISSEIRIVTNEKFTTAANEVADLRIGN
jgi:hypothetical protein